MAVERIPQHRGASRAKIICDECARDEVVPCAYTKDRTDNETQPNQSQARAKAIALGWEYSKGKLRCQKCAAKRKAKPVKLVQPKQPAQTAATKRQRIEIITMLAEVYDIDAGRYMQGDTDKTVADVLGVMPGWVSEIRDAEFGPDGSNQSMEELEVRLAVAVKSLAELRQVAEQLDGIGAELGKIKAAVGGHVIKRAGI